MVLGFGIIDIAVDCGLAVNDSGVIVGGTSPFEDVRPLQADMNTSSRLIPTHVTFLPLSLVLNLLFSLRNRGERTQVSGKLTSAEMNTNVNPTFILLFSLPFKTVVIEQSRCY